MQHCAAKPLQRLLLAGLTVSTERASLRANRTAVCRRIADKIRRDTGMKKGGPLRYPPSIRVGRSVFEELDLTIDQGLHPGQGFYAVAFAFQQGAAFLEGLLDDYP